MKTNNSVILPKPSDTGSVLRLQSSMNEIISAQAAGASVKDKQKSQIT